MDREEFIKEFKKIYEHGKRIAELKARLDLGKDPDYRSGMNIYAGDMYKGPGLIFFSLERDYYDDVTNEEIYVTWEEFDNPHLEAELQAQVNAKAREEKLKWQENERQQYERLHKKYGKKS